MAYDSPRQIRRRQLNAENKAQRPHRAKQARTVKTFTDPAWVGACDFHIERIQEHIEQGRAEAAGRHAEALAHMARTRRALDLMRVKPADYYTAMMRAEVELYGEVE